MKMYKTYSKDFGKKERVLNYACQRYQLSRPNKVGKVMALIRDCNPLAFGDWEEWYFKNACTKSKNPVSITKETLYELGERLYAKITEFVIPEWSEVFKTLSLQDCIDYIYNLTIHRTYDGYIREKFVVLEFLEKRLPEIKFEETPPELDHAGDIDYFGITDKGNTIGIQIKPVTAQANFVGYSLTERMRKSFEKFTKKYGGKVYVIMSVKDKIVNEKIIEEIKKDININN
ncbi:MAG: MjaI family restriction endonuclease [Oscillospiraceae bacterium]|nr:MjaI family restriction endonuclease [Oscillospiraceae bacterium]